MLVGQRRDDAAQRLRQQHQAEQLGPRQAQRQPGIALAARHRLDPGAHGFGNVGGGVERQAEDQREEFRHISYIRAACVATIKGHGLEGYLEALRLLCKKAY